MPADDTPPLDADGDAILTPHEVMLDLHALASALLDTEERRVRHVRTSREQHRSPEERRVQTVIASSILLDLLSDVSHVEGQVELLRLALEAAVRRDMDAAPPDDTRRDWDAWQRLGEQRSRMDEDRPRTRMSLDWSPDWSPDEDEEEEEEEEEFDEEEYL